MVHQGTQTSAPALVDYVKMAINWMNVVFFDWKIEII